MRCARSPVLRLLCRVRGADATTPREGHAAERALHNHCYGLFPSTERVLCFGRQQRKAGTFWGLRLRQQTGETMGRSLKAMVLCASASAGFWATAALAAPPA